MKLKIIFAYLGLPFLWMLFTFVRSVWQDTSITEIVHVTTMSGIFYLLPFLLWIVIARFAGFSLIYWHAGLIAASVAFIYILSCSVFGQGDPSGLPYEWYAYWPLAAVLQIMFIGSVFLYKFSKRQ